MSMYIVDCRYPRTTTPVGIPDFTLLVEAANTEDAMQRAEQADCGDDFVAVGACDALALVDMLRSHVRILAEFGLEMARKNRDADVAEFEALVSTNGISMPDSEDDDQEDEDDEGEHNDPWYLELVSDQRKRAAKLAFEEYGFEAYGGIAQVVGWFGIAHEERALISLGGCAEPEHVFVVEFDEDREDRIIHIGVESFEKTPWNRMHHFDGEIVKHNNPIS